MAKGIQREATGEITGRFDAVTVGFFFALGHSAVVFLVAVAVAATASALENRFESWRVVGGTVSTSVSAIFLFANAGMNIGILRGVWMAFKKIRNGLPYEADDLELLLIGFTTRDITVGAGVNAAAINYNFQTRKALVRAMLAEPQVPVRVSRALCCA